MFLLFWCFLRAVRMTLSANNWQFWAFTFAKLDLDFGTSTRLFDHTFHPSWWHFSIFGSWYLPISARTVPGSLPMPIIDRSLTSRTSSRRTIASLPSRRASSAQGCRGIAVSGSRAGAARTAAILLLSCHSESYDVSLKADTRFGTGAPVSSCVLFALSTLY